MTTARPASNASSADTGRPLPPGVPEHDRRRAEALPTTMLLVALSATAPLSMDMFLPSMPTMADEFERANRPCSSP